MSKLEKQIITCHVPVICSTFSRNLCRRVRVGREQVSQNIDFKIPRYE